MAENKHDGFGTDTGRDAEKDYPLMSCKELSESESGLAYAYASRCRSCAHFRRNCPYVN